MSYGYPASNNTFVPSHEASGFVVAGYSRNVDKFKVMRYVQRIPVTKSQFYVLNWNSQEGDRIRSAANANEPGAEYLWQDGNDAPSGIANLESFEYQIFETKRYAYPFNIGNKAVMQADWNILAAHAGVEAQKAMTHRTLKVYKTLTGAGLTSNTATSLGGGKFNVGTPTNPYLKIGLFSQATSINQGTMGVVDISNLCIVMNPNTAFKIGSSQEITDNLKYVGGLRYIMDGNVVTVDPNWGLPDRLYGFETIVEDATINTAAKGASPSRSYIVPDGTILMLSKQSGLEGIEGGPSFSSVQMYAFEEFTVESKVDVDNRRTMGRVITDYAIAIPDQAKKASAIITAAI